MYKVVGQSGEGSSRNSQRVGASRYRRGSSRSLLPGCSVPGAEGPQAVITGDINVAFSQFACRCFLKVRSWCCWLSTPACSSLSCCDVSSPFFSPVRIFRPPACAFSPIGESTESLRERRVPWPAFPFLQDQRQEAGADPGHVEP